MEEKKYFEVATFVWNSDPENYCKFYTLEEAEAEYKSQRSDLFDEIKEAIRHENDKDQSPYSGASSRTVELNEVTDIIDEDGDIYDSSTSHVHSFGDVSDWDTIRQLIDIL